MTIGEGGIILFRPGRPGRPFLVETFQPVAELRMTLLRIEGRRIFETERVPVIRHMRRRRSASGPAILVRPTFIVRRTFIVPTTSIMRPTFIVHTTFIVRRTFLVRP